MFRSYSQAEEIKKEDLLNNVEFIDDVEAFLRERKGVTEPMTAEESYDAFMQHMRFHNVNEVTTIRDLEYAQNANIEGKLRFGSLIDAFDKIDEGVGITGAVDYMQGLATAPSTYLGIATGGSGKLAALAGVQGAKIATRKILSEALKGSTKAMAVEGAIGFGQGAVQEQARVETRLQDRATGVRPMVHGATSAVTAGLVHFPLVSIPQTLAAKKANEKFVAQQFIAAEKATKARENSKIVIRDSSVKEVSEVKDTLKSLNPELVRKGRLFKQTSSTSDTLEFGLPVEVMDNITAAAIQIKRKIKPQKNERVTSALQRAMERNETGLLDDVSEILEEHNLNYDTFSYFFLSEISDAGRVLGGMGKLSREIGEKSKLKEIETPKQVTYKFSQKIVDGLLADLDKLNAVGKSSIDSDGAKKLLENRNALTGFFKDLDRLRLGVMTSQPATTMRNNLNGGFRVAIDATTRTFDNILSARNPFDGTFDIAAHMLNPYESMITQQIFKETFPELSAKLFREAADLEAMYGAEGALATLGRKVNFLNTMSDNIWKRAVLSASLKRRISDIGFQMTDDIREKLLANRIFRMGGNSRADVRKIIDDAKQEGTINNLYKENGNLLEQKKLHFHDLLETDNLQKIPQDVLRESIEDAYDFVYQTSFKGTNFFGKLAKGTIKAHQDIPFLISSFLPFPRYVANQMKFIYQHTPVLGLLPLDKPLSKESVAELGKEMAVRKYLREKMPKQMTGAMLFMTAYNWRLKQGDTTNWYEFKDNNENIVDGRPVYGPFAAHVLVADFMIRYQNGGLPANKVSIMRDGLQATLGSTFRTGMGLYALDNLLEDLPDLFSRDAGGKGTKILAEGIGNVMNTFLLPVSALRDVYAQFDEDARGIPETRNGEMNFLDILYARGTRSLPKNFASEYTERARSAFETGDLMQVNPLEKQMFGLTKRKPKNKLQAEMTKVGLRPFDVYRRDKNEIRDKYIRELLSTRGGAFNLEDNLNTLMESDRYKKLPYTADGRAIKRDMLDAAAKNVIAQVRDKADARIEMEAYDAGASYTYTDSITWQRLNRVDKNRIDAEYRMMLGGENSVSADRDKTVTIGGKRINVLQWALSRAKQIRGQKGSD
tara:strand:+ start:1962 stop:5309 length:3348 start_codon:yes stop_codon:yes gene_type:complete